jgi:Dolichyl-phosphate-mannose-protein mannosyltransferase
VRRTPWSAGWEAAAVAALTVLAGLLRVAGLGDAPYLTDNADELQFSWAGLNLIAHGDAYTWSYFKSYPQPVTVIQGYGTSFPMVHHWMDHPPGFSLLIGGWLWLTGSHDMLALTPERVRALPVVFAMATVPLGYLALRRALGGWPAFSGALLLATAPGAVLISRQAEPEAVLAPLLLGATLLADSLGHCGESRFPRWQVALLLLVAFLAPTFKVTGLAVGGIAAVALIAHNRPKLAALVVLATVLGGLVYPLYGWLVDWKLFLGVVHEQSRNRIGMMAAYEFIAAPAGINRPLRDGWWLLGWIALGYLLFTGRRSRAELLLAWPAFAYVLVVMLLAGEELTSRYGWYRLILMPQVMLAAGALAWRAIAAPSPARLAAVLALGGATATNWWLAGAGGEWVVDPILGSILLGLVLVPAAITTAPRFASYRPVAQGLAAGALVLLAIGNVVETLELPVLFGRL